MAAAAASCARASALLAGLLLSACGAEAPGGAADPPSHFYVLAVSWSPSFCAAEGIDANRRQCGARPGFGYVVHGLWPQFEEGWPEFCEPGSEEWVPDGIVADMLDIMPSPGLIGHQWRKHGSCSGLPQEDYFALTRRAFERVALPEPDSPRVRPREFAGAVASVNDGLGEDGFAVTCDGEFLREIRICMRGDLAFRACPEVAARSCRLAEAMMPPVPR